MSLRALATLALIATLTACNGSSSSSSQGSVAAPLATTDTRALATVAATALAVETQGTTPPPPDVQPLLGEQRVLVLLVNFKDAPVTPWSVDDARRVVFEETDAFVRASSGGRAWLAGDVAGWFTLPISVTTTDHHAISSAARDVARSKGVLVDSYEHLVVAFPHDAALPFQGEGTVGGVPTIAWANGVLDVHTVAHELGHNFGLHHARSLSASSLVAEYGDPFSVMGAGTGDHSAPDKVRLGWLEATEVRASGTFPLRPLEEPGATALRIPCGRTVYWVEARKGANGIVVRLEDPQGDLIVGSGSSFVDEASGLALEADATSVTVTLGEATGGRAVVDLDRELAGTKQITGALALDYRREGTRVLARATFSNVQVDAKPATGVLELEASGGVSTARGNLNGVPVASFSFSLE